MSRPLMEAKRLVLGVDVPESGLAVLADAARLGQVISNVLNNAARFTGAGGTIAVRAWADEADAVLTVTDSGIGMSASDLDRVFEMFVQGGQGLDRAQGGLGLGLTIARNLAHLHGGSLRAESPGPGLGSVFTLRLPRHNAASADQSFGRLALARRAGCLARTACAGGR